MLRKTLTALIPALIIASPALAQGSGHKPAPRPPGTETSIPFATHGGIRTFTPDRNGEGVYLEDNRRNWYYAKFVPRCENLDFAFQVGFKTFGGGPSLSRGDTIFAGGERCFITSLVTSAPPPEKPKKAKKAA
ncbi:DUF6491 family protein [Sphingomonas sp.]|uniref:DUF6491 family protein n=1 Tax=Sphingomonas sp. TaxID=28214 RepID=UPI001B269814|nr:DUF6491 family protein [Sphingomonas sp.]MBO9715194.1 hypothetical protein [Sphingomonas sp.]